MDGVSGPTNARRLLIVGSLALVAVVSFGLTLALLSSGERNPSAGQKPSAGQESSSSGEPVSGGGFVASGPAFESLDQMVASSDLVATGTVTEALPGKVIRDVPADPAEEYPEGSNAVEGPPPPPEKPKDDVAEDYPTRTLKTVVKIDEVLKGSAPVAGVLTVETLELAYARPNLEWRKPGERVLLYLKRDTESGEPTPIYFPANYSQSAYVLRDNDLMATVSDPVMPVIERVAGLSLPQLRAEVEQAKTKIASGEVKPLELER